MRRRVYFGVDEYLSFLSRKKPYSVAKVYKFLIHHVIVEVVTLSAARRSIWDVCNARSNCNTTGITAMAKVETDEDGMLHHVTFAKERDQKFLLQSIGRSRPTSEQLSRELTQINDKGRSVKTARVGRLEYGILSEEFKLAVWRSSLGWKNGLLY